MPVLKDMFCTACGGGRELVVDADETKETADCDRCKAPTVHVSRCTGGARLKAYITDFTGRDWSGDIETYSISATEGEHGPEVTDRGERIRDRPRFSNDRRAARRDEIESAQRRRDGRTRLMFDQARATSARR